MTFKDIPEARKVINMYSLANGYDLQQVKSDPIRLRYICVGDCPFVCHISKDSSRGEVREMRASLKAAFNLNVSESKCKRAKKIILEKLEGSFIDEYNKLVAYANELKLTNPGSDVIINLSKDALEEGKMRFLRMYICFQAMKSMFKSGLRPFIGLDGTFLKGKAKGHLQASLDLKMGEGITLMSDMQRKQIGVRDGALVSSKNCFGGVITTYEEDFKDQIKNMGQVDDVRKEAVEDLLKYPPKCWSRAFFDIVCKNQSVDNNLTESFNAWILQARHKPIIKMLEDIRIKVMNMITEHEDDVM
ncbi:uncharacterized protein LOC107822141 [Nicotiana tabacum]|uniref:Uncharacterized protein LOC107822141 n=1 Tax=Nicotiana tabacum TaxID=4097 RepID=A0AC58T5K3_TOBAC